jgi:cell division protein ZapB
LETPELQLLETKLDTLLSTLNQLAEENQTLREQQAHLIAERAVLIEKNTIARTRVEAMIARLKALEADADIS